MPPVAPTAAAQAAITARDAAPPSSAAASSASSVKRLTILYTNDEHGWLVAQKNKDGQVGGAAEMLGQWQKDEKYAPDGPFLVLSGGDMWTGPAISTWFSGESAAEAMNAMGYQAAAIGNHDFDFGLDVLRRRAKAARFPYLAANVVNKGTTETPDFARPYAIVDAGGVKVGIVGLSTLATPRTTTPKNVAGFDFLPYADALARYVPQVKAAGADLVIVLAHVCGAEMRALAPRAKQLGVHVLTAGHCHERIAEEVAGLPLLGSGSFWQAYARLTVDVDTATLRATTGKPQVVSNTAGATGGPVDAALASRITYWQAQTDKDLGEVIGYTRNGLASRSNALVNLLTDAWLEDYPTAQVAMTNLGGFRQGIDAGPITLGDIMNVLPFSNQIVDAAVTGAQLKENLDCCGGAVAGITYRRGKLLLADGTPIDPKKTYHVLINDFMATGGDNYRFGKQDPDAYFTAIDWRQPLIDYLKRLGTSQQAPLESHLDTDPRTDR
jgi:2',3'-cyclic-nucleotide 2'-phosphodiesterase (5'-nucleotidase family)